MAFSGCCSSRNVTYDVFLSFRGIDTRLKFTGHLFAALEADGLMITFRDDEELPYRGEALKPSLLHAIEESFSAIVVLSKNYANSTWCLEELAKIVDCHEDLGLQIFPIFYEVEPSDVRHQEGVLERDFKKHEEEYEHDKVQRWRNAFEAVANLPGRSSHGNESEVIKGTVEWVRSKLYAQALSGSNDDDGLIGMGEKIAKIESIIAKEREVKFVGIHGMGGLGKTTLARAIYEKRKSNFVFHFFLPNVRERSATHVGLTELQQKLLSRPNKRNEMEVSGYEEGKKLIKTRLHKRKVLLVLDDVSDISQLENLAGEKAWFGPGSRIIITTRDQRLLFDHGVDSQYEMTFLSPVQSRKLFLQKAFKGNEEPDEDYLKLSEKVIKSAGGLPLALKVFGSFLYGRSKAEWEEALKKIHSSDGDRVFHILKVSFARLGQNEKDTFLDIACFFNGMPRKYIKQTLQDCGLLPEIGIQRLIEKSLVIEEKGCLRLHDTIQEMGQKIICDTHDDAGERSRIWSLEDANHVLGNNMGTKAIRGIAVRFYNRDIMIEVDPEAFSSMRNLKLLVISVCEHDQLKLPHGLTCLSNTLKVIQWDNYPLTSLPKRTQFDQLVDLKMQCSQLKELWIGAKYLNYLKSIDLSHSTNLIRTLDFNKTPNLQRLILEGCTKLDEVHHSLEQHKNLVEVNFRDCKRIKTLPTKFEMNRLKTFVLDGCLKIKTLPEFGEGMECLSELHLRRTAISTLPESLVNLTGLTGLGLESCENLVCLPSDFQKLKAIEGINVSGCLLFSKLPENLNENEALKELILTGTAIEEVPSSLNKLKFLSLSECKLRRPLPNIPSLIWLNLSNCNLDDGSLPSAISNLPSSLTSLFLSGNNFVEIPSGLISKLINLELIHLEYCLELRSLPQLPSRVSIICATDCPLLEDYVRREQQLWEFFVQFDSQTSCPSDQISEEEDGSNNYYLHDILSRIKTWDVQVPEFFMQPTRILTITGNEVPSWFHNQDYFCVKDFPYDTPNNVSFKVNMSGSSELWGIGVCLVVLRQDWKDHNVDRICWTYKDLDGEYSTSYRDFCFGAFERHHHLCIICIRFSSFFVEKLQMVFFAMNKDGLSPKIEIVKCGWRVLSKEDVERWQNAREEGPLLKKRSIC